MFALKSVVDPGFLKRGANLLFGQFYPQKLLTNGK